MSLEVLMAADIEIVVWFVTPCRLSREYQRFEETPRVVEGPVASSK